MRSFWCCLVSTFAVLVLVATVVIVSQQSGARTEEQRLSAELLPAGTRWRDVTPPSFLIGGVLHGYGSPFQDSTSYREHIAGTEFNSITSTIYYGWNAWDFLTDPDEAYVGMDAVVAWAERQELPVHGHVLVYPLSTKDRYKTTIVTDADIRERLQAFIDTTAARYAGQVHVWDVANEVLGDDADLRDARGLRTHWDADSNDPVRDYHAFGGGSSYVEQAFVRARAQDPNAVLILNDYGVGIQNAKSDRYLEYVVYLKTVAGVPLDGVGFQMHWTNVHFTPSVEAMRQNLQRFADQGLRVFVTELDVVSTPSPEFPTDAEQLRQRTVFENVLNACLLVAACEACWLWDFADDVSWLGPETYATPFWNKDGGVANAKPSYYGIQSSLERYRGSYSINCWWEPTTGFLGRYGRRDASGEWIPQETSGLMAYSPLNFDHLRFVLERTESGKDEYRLRSRWNSQQPDAYLTHADSNQILLRPLQEGNHRQRWILEQVYYPNRELGTGDLNEHHTNVYRLKTQRGLYLSRNGREVSPGVWEALDSVSAYNGKNPRWRSQLWTLGREK